ncbi:MAG: ribosomal RNA small subunit methyltransferase A [Clostridia bacterium]|nr:ribosomal RNA small subunit methyltransferase A [Clostridia bacterium]
MIDFVFKKKFGQNFISDKNLLNAISADAGVDQNDEVLEIGAGAGSLTQVLSEKAKKVVSFEIDKDLIDHLNSLKLENVEFVFGDFMDADIKDVESKFDGKYKVVANLPYYITTPIIFKLLENSERLDCLTIMVQKEVAERVCAKVGSKEYGILTVMVNFYGKPQITRIINRQMFHPAPNVDSALLSIKLEEKYPQINKQEFSKFVKTCFSMRRKTLLNNLAPYGKDKLKTVFDEKTLQRRAESLSLEEFVEMFEKLK